MSLPVGQRQGVANGRRATNIPTWSGDNYPDATYNYAKGFAGSDALAAIKNVLANPSAPRPDPADHTRHTYNLMPYAFVGKQPGFTRVLRMFVETTEGWWLEWAPAVRQEELVHRFHTDTYHRGTLDLAPPLSTPSLLSRSSETREEYLVRYHKGFVVEADFYATEAGALDVTLKMAQLSSNTRITAKLAIASKLIEAKNPYREWRSRYGEVYTHPQRALADESTHFGILSLDEKGAYKLVEHVRKVMRTEQRAPTSAVLPSGTLTLISLYNEFETEAFRRGTATMNSRLRQAGASFLSLAEVKFYEDEDWNLPSVDPTGPIRALVRRTIIGRSYVADQWARAHTAWAEHKYNANVAGSFQYLEHTIEDGWVTLDPRRLARLSARFGTDGKLVADHATLIQPGTITGRFAKARLPVPFAPGVLDVYAHNVAGPSTSPQGWAITRVFGEQDPFFFSISRQLHHAQIADDKLSLPVGNSRAWDALHAAMTQQLCNVTDVTDPNFQGWIVAVATHPDNIDAPAANTAVGGDALKQNPFTGSPKLPGVRDFNEGDAGADGAGTYIATPVGANDYRFIVRGGRGYYAVDAATPAAARVGVDAIDGETAQSVIRAPVRPLGFTTWPNVQEVAAAASGAAGDGWAVGKRGEYVQTIADGVDAQREFEKAARRLYPNSVFAHAGAAPTYQRLEPGNPDSEADASTALATHTVGKIGYPLFVRRPVAGAVGAAYKYMVPTLAAVGTPTQPDPGFDEAAITAAERLLNAAGVPPAGAGGTPKQTAALAQFGANPNATAQDLLVQVLSRDELQPGARAQLLGKTQAEIGAFLNAGWSGDGQLGESYASSRTARVGDSRFQWFLLYEVLAPLNGVPTNILQQRLPQAATLLSAAFALAGSDAGRGFDLSEDAYIEQLRTARPIASKRAADGAARFEPLKITDQLGSAGSYNTYINTRLSICAAGFKQLAAAAQVGSLDDTVWQSLVVRPANPQNPSLPLAAYVTPGPRGRVPATLTARLSELSQARVLGNPRSALDNTIVGVPELVRDAGVGPSKRPRPDAALFSAQSWAADSALLQASPSGDGAAISYWAAARYEEVYNNAPNARVRALANLYASSEVSLDTIDRWLAEGLPTPNNYIFANVFCVLDMGAAAFAAAAPFQLGYNFEAASMTFNGHNQEYFVHWHIWMNVALVDQNNFVIIEDVVFAGYIRGMDHHNVYLVGPDDAEARFHDALAFDPSDPNPMGSGFVFDVGGQFSKEDLPHTWSITGVYPPDRFVDVRLTRDALIASAPHYPSAGFYALKFRLDGINHGMRRDHSSLAEAKESTYLNVICSQQKQRLFNPATGQYDIEERGHGFLGNYCEPGMKDVFNGTARVLTKAVKYAT